METHVNFKGGGSFVEICPKFSLNAEILYVAWKNQIFGYNVTTGKRGCVFTGIKSDIVDFYVHSLDVYECLTACSSDGEVVTWKAGTFFKIGNSNLGLTSIKTFSIYCPTNSYQVKGLISYQWMDEVKFVLYDFDTGKWYDYSLELSSFPYYIDVLSSGYFVIAQQNRIYFLHINDLQEIRSIKMQQSRHFTCISCHPTENSLLTGDNTGRIVLWQNIFNTVSKPTQTVYHWHTLSLNCVNFSMNGTQFYSGGNESVLVKWFIDNPNQKNFLPRLQSEIKHIKLSSHNRYISLSLNDNSIYIIDTQFRKVSIIQSLVIGELLEDNFIYDARTKCLLLNGSPGCLQFYLPNDANLLYNLDVIDANKISNERQCEIKNTQITRFTIDKTGLWLATIEENHYYEYSPEIRLKFWQFNLEKQQFKLNTSIEYPHTTKVNSIKYQPIDDNDKNRLKFLTVGDDKLFKIWQLTSINDNDDSKVGWIFYSCGYYRNLPCRIGSFSIDGTLFGVNFDNFLTLWSPETNELKTTLSNPYSRESIKNINFGTNDQCHLIVTATENLLTVWNLLTLTIAWMVNVDIDFFITDPITTNMAIITKNRKLFIFTPNSPQPIYKSKTLLKEQKIRNCCFVPTKYSNDVRLEWYQRSTIFFINSQKELYCIGGDADEPTSLFYDDDDKLNDNETLLGKLNPNIKSISKQSRVDKQIVLLPEQKNIKKYLEAPIHSSVPIRILCKSLLKSMILQK